MATQIRMTEISGKNIAYELETIYGIEINSISGAGREFEIIFQNDLSPEQLEIVKSVADKYSIFIDTGIEPKRYHMTGDYRDPRDFDHRIRGLYKDLTIDDYGDISVIDFYKTYNPPSGSMTGSYLDLVVKEERVYKRSADTGLLVSRQITGSWYYTDGSVGTTKNTSKYYTVESGYAGNIRARENLINKASIWLYGDLISEYGLLAGESKAKEFLYSIITEISTYTKGNIQPLLSAVSASSQEYMTPTRKSTLDFIINVEYP